VSEDQKPQGQPLSKLPLIAAMVDGMLADTEEQYQKLLEARPRPHVLDDYTVRRVTKLYGEQREDVYAQQVPRSADGPLTAVQREN
jgi:hypothetical protein